MNTDNSLLLSPSAKYGKPSEYFAKDKWWFLGKAEVERTAYALVRYLATHGDEWREVRAGDMDEWARSEGLEYPLWGDRYFFVDVALERRPPPRRERLDCMIGMRTDFLDKLQDTRLKS